MISRIRLLLVSLVYGCLIQGSQQNLCGTNYQNPDWTTLDGLSISTMADVLTNMQTIVNNYKSCPKLTADRLTMSSKSCTIAEATQMFCTAQTMDVMVGWLNTNTGLEWRFGSCLSTADQCKFYADAFLSNTTSACFLNVELQKNADFFTQFCATSYLVNQGKTVNLDILALTTKDALYTYLNSLNSTLLTLMLNEVLAKPTLYELFTCYDKIQIMTLIDSQSLTDSVLQGMQALVLKVSFGQSLSLIEQGQMNLFVRFLPYFTTTICTSALNIMGTFLITNKQYMAHVKFECLVDGSFLQFIKDSGGASALAGYTTQEQIPFQVLTTLYDNIRYQNAIQGLCSSGCAERLADMAVTQVLPSTITVNNAYTLIGDLTACLDETDVENLNLTDSCQSIAPKIVELASRNPVLHKLLDDCNRPTNPTQVTASQVQSFGCFLLCSRNTYILQVPTSVLCQAVATDMSWSCLTESVCKNKFIIGYLAVVCSQAANINTMLTTYKSLVDYPQMTTGITVANFMTYAKDVTGDENINLWRLKCSLTNYLGAASAKVSYTNAIFNDFTYPAVNSVSDVVMAAVMAKVSTANDMLTAMNSFAQMNGGLKMFLASEILERFFVLYPTTTLTQTVLQAIPSNVAPAMTTTQMTNALSCGSPDIQCEVVLCKISDLGFNALKGNFLSQKVVTALEVSAQAATGNSLDFSKSISPAEASLMDGGCFRTINETHLTNLASNTLLVKAMCTQMAKDTARRCLVRKDKRTAAAKACFKSYNYDVEQQSTSIDNNAVDLAALAIDLTELPGSVQVQTTFTSTGGILNIAKCPHLIPSQTRRNELITLLKTYLSATAIASWNFQSVGCWVVAVYQTYTDTASKTDLEKYIAKNEQKILEIMTGSDVTSEFTCIKEEQSDQTIIDEMDTILQSYYNSIVVAAKATLGTAGSAVTTCATIRGIPVSMLPSEIPDINAISAEEILLCLYYLGESTGWSSEQAVAILNKITGQVGWPQKSAMKYYHICALGTIAYALTDTDIQALTIDDDMVACFGCLFNWTDAQLSAIAARYMTLVPVTPSTLAEYQLDLMMHIVCGVNMISEINAATYKASASVLGQCNPATTYTCLQSLAALAVNTAAFGPASAWTSKTYFTVGCVAVGLSGDDLNQANADSIAALGNLVAYIPPAEFKKMSAATLSTFSRVQVLALTDGQLAVLDESQKAALESISGVAITVSSSADGVPIVSFTAVISTLMAVMLMS